MEITQEKSKQQAEVIELIKPYLSLLDEDYCFALVKEMKSQASRQEAMSVLNPSHNPKRNTRLRTQAKALSHLANFKRLMIESTELKQEIKTEAEQRETIGKLFI